MAVEVVTKKEITQLLNDWYQEMCLQHVIKATKLKEEVESKINRIEGNQEILIYYSLLDFRYKMLTGNFQTDYNQPITEQQTNIFLKYYYHFFKFIYATEIGNYSNAKKHFKLAEEYLVDIPDEAEKAEFNYRVAAFYYLLSQHVLSIHYAKKAEEFFSDSEGYEVKKGACKSLLGLACNSLGQYELAENYLLLALDSFKKTNDDALIKRVRHNLGLLYADQDLSEIAIRHLKDAIENYKGDTTLYLLARENYKLNKTEEAAKYIKEGLKVCNKEYAHHFSILKVKNDNVPIKKLEGIFLSALEYFKEQELWKDVMVYTEELAIKCFEAGDNDKASTYFHMSYEAKQTLRKQGALK